MKPMTTPDVLTVAVAVADVPVLPPMVTAVSA